MPVECRLTGLDSGTVSGRVLTASAMNAHNTFDAPYAIAPADFTGAVLKDGLLTLTLPAKSVVVLAVKK